MDGFDDLLAPSRRVLEDNPFADPFAKRSNSPDPWASPFANGQLADDYGQSTTPTAESYVATDTYESSLGSSDIAGSAPPVPSDPLDSATQAADEENEQESDKPRGRSTSSSRTPGFRESVAPAFSEIATIRPTEPEEPEPPALTPVEQYRSSPPPRKADSPSTTPSSPVSQESHHTKRSSQGGSRVVSPSPSTSKTSEFVSPLEKSPIGIDHSIAGLSLGGEALGGWQSEQAGWGAQDDDSDDDKPISQTVRIPEQIDNKLVCTLYYHYNH
jgi:sorting nexin-1/2